MIVCDLSQKFEAFARLVGGAVREFAENGGRVAFLSAEAHLLNTNILKPLFDVDWRNSGYYRTTWGMTGVVDVFASSPVDTPYSAKACSWRGVPKGERCLGVVPGSRHESLAMILHGHTDAGPGEGDYDVAVATKQIGTGRILVCGDVNLEVGTCRLVLAFCRAALADVHGPTPSRRTTSTPAAAPTSTTPTTSPASTGGKKRKRRRARGPDQQAKQRLHAPAKLVPTARSRVIISLTSTTCPRDEVNVGDMVHQQAGTGAGAGENLRG